MTFWKRLRRLGQILFVAIAAVTLSAAWLLSPDEPPSMPGHAVPGLAGPKGPSGL